MTHFLPRALLMAASTLALAACASTPAYPIVEGQAPGTGPQPIEIRPMRKPAYPITAPKDDEATPPPVSDRRADMSGYDDAPAAGPVQKVDVAYMRPVASTGHVETTDLAAPRRSERADPEDDAPPERTVAAKPRTETKTTLSVAGKVVAVEGKPKTYTVKEGQGLDAVARALDTTRKQLADDNKLKEPYKLKPGQVLKGPASKGKAYVVGSGDTLFSIAKRFNVTAKALAEENDLTTKSAIKSGQKLRLPENFKDSGPVKKTTTTTLPPAPAPVRPKPRPVTPPPEDNGQPDEEPTAPAPKPYTPPEPKPSTPASPRPYSPPPNKPYTPPVTTPVTPTKPYTPPSKPYTPPAATPGEKPPLKTEAELIRMATGRFDWPVRGTIIQTYGDKPGMQRNQGVDIGASAGTSVRAAADGIVVLSSEVPDNGFMVILQHADGWYTIYMHLQGKQVDMQSRVTKGQQIGRVGQTGDVSRPQLHFEVRYLPVKGADVQTVDPAKVLPN